MLLNLAEEILTCCHRELCLPDEPVINPSTSYSQVKFFQWKKSKANMRTMFMSLEVAQLLSYRKCLLLKLLWKIIGNNFGFLSYPKTN